MSKPLGLSVPWRTERPSFHKRSDMFAVKMISSPTHSATNQEIMSNIVNPNELSPEFMAALQSSPVESFKSADQGCATTLVAALDPEISSKFKCHATSILGATDRSSRL